MIDTVVNDLVRQHIKQKKPTNTKLVDYDSTSPGDDDNRIVLPAKPVVSTSRPSLGKQLAVAQPPCNICKKKTNLIVFCDHCKCDICELCSEQHRRNVAEVLHEKWNQCKNKFDQLNEHVSVSHQNKTAAISKLDILRQTIGQRSENLKIMIENHRKILVKHIDDHIQNLDQMIKTDRLDDEYKSVKARVPKMLEGEPSTSKLLAFLEETEGLLQRMIAADKQLKQMDLKVPVLLQSDLTSINVSNLIGELKFEDKPLQCAPRHQTNGYFHPNDGDFAETSSPPALGSMVNGRVTSFPYRRRGSYPRRMRSPIRSRAGRGDQYLSSNNGIHNSNSRGLNFRGRISSRSRPYIPRLSMPSFDNNIDTVPNHRTRWSLDFKEIPHLLAVLDDRTRANKPDTRPHHRHSYMLFISDNCGKMVIHGLPKPNSHMSPPIVGTGELFPRNSRLLMESFAVYEFAIVVYVRRFEQRTNEMEHSKLMKAGLPIMKGEQGRCNDHGGEEIDDVYQSNPIRTILVDPSFGRLWTLNPMHNKIYCYMAPTRTEDIRKCLQDEEIVLSFADESPSELFEPSTMIQSAQSIGLTDTEHDLYRLYPKDDSLCLITTYQNSRGQSWQITGGVIFNDNRTLLKLTEDTCLINDPNDQNKRNKFGGIDPRRRLIELSADGEEKREIQANTLYSMVLGPNDEVILGFAVRGDRGLIQCY